MNNKIDLNLKTKDKIIVMFSGGTLGHIVPALTIVKELNSIGYKIYFVSDNNKFKDIFIGKSYLERIIFIDSPGLKRKRIFVFRKTFTKASQAEV